MATELRALSNSVVAMAFGMCLQAELNTAPVGALSALADDLTRRGLLPELIEHLGPKIGHATVIRINVDRVRARRQAR